MSNLEKYEAFFETSSGCLSASQIDLYTQQKLNKKDKHQFEKHLLNCEFCTEAVEGVLGFEKTINVSQISTQLTSQIAEKHLSKKTKGIPLFSYLKVAASVLVVLTAGLFLFDMGFPSNENMAFSDEKQMTEETQTIKIESADTDLEEEISPNIKEHTEELKEEKVIRSQEKKETLNEELLAKKETNKKKNITASPSVTESNDEKSDLNEESNTIATADKEGEVLADFARATQNEEEISSEEIEEEADDSMDLALKATQDSFIENKTAGGVAFSEEEILQKEDVIRQRKAAQRNKPSLKNIKRQVKKDSNNLNLRYEYALAYFEAQQWDKSLGQFEKVLTDTSQTHYFDAIWYKALILIEQQKLELAKEYLNKLLENPVYQKHVEQKLKEIE